ncbi:hypothetical protein [Rhizobium sp. BK456]|uniref:hypothetical protein n=1 Tax=Rhizobium sp. BK456 TaxID=2587007 RepID=UPI001619104C|nr:hypothetical protein [Rhizobium sp. BK456]MBB3521057.1 hypothetical protein [Rhizobium sp. BK456]
MKKPASMKPVAKAGGSPKAAPAKTVSKSSGSKGLSVSPSYAAEDKRWKTEDAMRTLMRAEELKKDRGLMRDVEALAKEQAQKLSGLCGKAGK